MDLDNGPTRTWAALGVQGLSLCFFDVEAAAYVSDRGRAAARLRGYYDLLIANRLILQPEAELNFYTKSDHGRGTGSGLSDIDARLRLRYELTRKLAPYVGVSGVVQSLPFRVTQVCGGLGPLGSDFDWGRVFRAGGSQPPPSSSPLGLKRSQAQQGQPVRMAVAGHQLARAFALALGVPAAHEAAVVQKEAQQVQVRAAEVTA